MRLLAKVRKLPYRWRWLNWLWAKPWRWRYRVIYRSCRNGASYTRYVHRHGRIEATTVVLSEPQGRMRSLWAAITFPHVHDPDEE